MLIQPISSKDETVIVVIKGKPQMIKGLDEGYFVSCKKNTVLPGNVYVMTEGEFKILGTK